ncbi:MAG: hypothetical protein ACYTFM_05900 [Planctomycetota bacterium]|jgi:uncharacterized repeat protein (TIGR04076 family)
MGKINYGIEIEIFKGKDCDHHRKGDKYRYPEDIGHICPWLLDSINTMIRVLQFGGTLPWKYKETEYEKTNDYNGITTEFIRCPDPTDAGVVAKITRKKLNSPKEVGWS